MVVERRRFPRILVKFLVEYRGEAVWQHAQSYNLSRGGMFIATDKVESPGTHIEIMFEIGKEKVRRIHAEAVVIWNRSREGETEGAPSGMGVQFLRIFPVDGEKFLEELVKKWEKK